MSRKRSLLLLALSLLVVLPLFLSGCQSAAPMPTTAPLPQPTQAQAQPTTVPPTTAPQGPQVGGTLVIVFPVEPDTLDIHKTTMSVMDAIMFHVGASLVTRDPYTGEIVPYLAESWEVSEDGLTWDFVLREGVRFHDGSPLTAEEYAWTINRTLDPEIQPYAPGLALASLVDAKALDERTLRLNFGEPFYPALVNLSSNTYASPLSRAAVEAGGEQYGRAPVGVGPFKFKEWKTGEKIVLERNPDYDWYPPFIESGPYIETIEFRFIAEDATAMAGLEAGEIDLSRSIQPKDVPTLRDSGLFDIVEDVVQGMNPYVQFNCGKPPFDDLRLRQALSYAVDREALIKVAAQGDAVAQYGPLSSTVAGYDPSFERMGYHNDPEKAKTILQEAGYTLGADGIMTKDGQPLRVTLITLPMDAWIKPAQILQQQWKAIGVDIEIVQQEQGQAMQNILSGEFTISMFGFGWSEADILAQILGSEEIGGMNLGLASDPQLDELFAATRTTLDPGKHQEAVNAAAQYIMDQALVIPLYAPKRSNAVSKRLKDYILSPITTELWLISAYIAD